MDRKQLIEKLVNDDIDTFIDMASRGELEEIYHLMAKKMDYDTMDDNTLIWTAKTRGLLPESNEVV